MGKELDLSAVERSLSGGVSVESLAAYGRWWQLETYLREVVYTELRAAHGADWTALLDGGVLNRAERDEINSYMASSDAGEILAYADTSVLVKLIDTHWELFESTLLPKARWEGLLETLLAIRHRIAHCRRTHPDDLGRIELALRDLESGARSFYGSYTDTRRNLADHRDPLVKAWVRQRDEAAARLIPHCEKKYDVRFSLGYSLRPWAERPAEKAALCGHPGVIWQAQWLLGTGEVRPATLWKELRPTTRELLTHLLIDGFSATASFSAMEDPSQLNEAIADLFEALVRTSRDYEPGFSSELVSASIAQMEAAVATLPPKVQFHSALSLFDPLNPEAFPIFSA